MRHVHVHVRIVQTYKCVVTTAKKCSKRDRGVFLKSKYCKKIKLGPPVLKIGSLLIFLVGVGRYRIELHEREQGHDTTTYGPEKVLQFLSFPSLNL